MTLIILICIVNKNLKAYSVCKKSRMVFCEILLQGKVVTFEKNLCHSPFIVCKEIWPCRCKKSMSIALFFIIDISIHDLLSFLYSLFHECLKQLRPCYCSLVIKIKCVEVESKAATSTLNI